HVAAVVTRDGGVPDESGWVDAVGRREHAGNERARVVDALHRVLEAAAPGVVVAVGVDADLVVVELGVGPAGVGGDGERPAGGSAVEQGGVGPRIELGRVVGIAPHAVVAGRGGIHALVRGAPRRRTRAAEGGLDGRGRGQLPVR